MRLAGQNALVIVWSTSIEECAMESVASLRFTVPPPAI